VSFDEYTIPPAGRVSREVLLKNVMAVLPGKSSRRLYVSGHYDTIARNPDGTFTGGDDNRLAPGANDDGSGTALVMELARVIARSGIEFDATIVFIALAGEEQGLIGAAQHAKKAAADAVVIDAVFNNDIVGGSVGGQGRVDSRTVRVYSEGPEDSPFALARALHSRSRGALRPCPRRYGSSRGMIASVAVAITARSTRRGTPASASPKRRRITAGSTP
jgi:Zn-dependent M28 family amino/carboxypeptidase